MSSQTRRYFIVHDERGRILAVAPVSSEETGERIRRGYRPVPGSGQRVIELELSGEHAALPSHALLELEVAIDGDTGNVYLRRPRS